MFFTSQTILVIRSVLLWTIGYYLLRDPVTVFKNPIVVVLGTSAQTRQTYLNDAGTLLPFAAMLLILTGFQDLSLILIETTPKQLQVVVSVRILTTFTLSALSYAGYLGLNTSVVFSYAFLELLLNFWMYLTVKEEDNDVSRRQIRQERGYEHDE